MGRTMKRVPLDFTWPINMIWKGYLNPYRSQKCEPCDGSGYSPQAKMFGDQWYGNAEFNPVAYGAEPLTVDHPAIEAYARRNVKSAPSFYGQGVEAVAKEAERLFRIWRGQWSHHLIQADVDALCAADRLWDFTRVPRTKEQRANCHENGWMKESNGYRPTPSEVNTWAITSLGHDAINQSVCVEARCQRESVDKFCSFCGGNAEIWQSPEIEALHDSWEPIEPPVGDGFQLWTTTNEGAPISPVFATIEELCEWCETDATTFGYQRATAAQWRKMFDADFVAHDSSSCNWSRFVAV